MKKDYSISPNLPSKDELYIKEFLDLNSISYITEYKIKGLKNDDRSYRVVDFYLTKLDVYFEYYGMYNANKAKRAEYDFKTKIYIENNLPTLIIYPHELGYLEYAFHHKLLKLLRIPKYYNRYKIIRYKLSRYFTLGKPYYIIFALVSLYLGAQALVASQHHYDIFYSIYLIASALIIGFIGDTIRTLYLIFAKDK
ncbi:MAG: hypothetical protein HRU50_00110 [Winogradskyella sp.]|uniref:hypothetical protein n=1 Tax=Winogradskyella sp. TaxID=1883156 RepID=UPI0025D045C9|nr:hypothetical protein [Winogradskyella sp.]NRB58323.1 hypothetical protein [Winogradskyella sp.]